MNIYIYIYIYIYIMNIQSDSSQESLVSEENKTIYQPIRDDLITYENI